MFTRTLIHYPNEMKVNIMIAKKSSLLSSFEIINEKIVRRIYDCIGPNPHKIFHPTLSRALDRCLKTFFGARETLGLNIVTSCQSQKNCSQACHQSMEEAVRSLAMHQDRTRTVHHQYLCAQRQCILIRCQGTKKINRFRVILGYRSF